ncbi:FAD binding domain-containing protein [Telluria mixta]|uniref:FAD binding domain-containing protein n=1 Tax=Telluria mixta TaxID=34071 RepID=A0ABT2C131_9BURK|nr:FAD binding domain-containing protein [Telluria mixta]MCS0631083.1 FAD binding domain-containing protein [Telluria mixta]WEM95626.1 FAD binding domain-containing protein [Telluria mixta]
MSPRALIIGGSLGGLLAANTLKTIGWRVDVFERSPHALDSRGGGIVLQPDVLHAFHFAGIRPAGALGVASGDRIYLDRKGDVVRRDHQPQTQTSWNMLHGTMRRALPDDCIHPGETLERVEQAGGQVRAVFASGRVETGDLLIGADGARSTVRSLMLPDVRPDYSGYVAWRGLVPEPDLDADSRAVLDGVFAFQHDDGEQMLLEYLVPGEDGSTAPGHRRWNWVWYRKVGQDDLPALLTDRTGRTHAFSLPPGALPDARAAMLRADARELLAPQFNALVQTTKEPFVQAILDLAVPRMVFGRVLLLGDAAFVPRPHTAGGAAKAAANALALAHALQRTDRPIDARLREWEVLQLRAGRDLVDWGRRMGDGIMGVPRAAGYTNSRAGMPGP